MTKKFLLLSFAILIGCQIYAQKKSNENSKFYINVFINADKDVFVESEKTEFSKITMEVKEIINKQTFKVDQKITYRIFADENLKLGYIMDVNQEMNKAYYENIPTNRYLLNTIELNIDGKNWFESKKIKELKSN